MGWTTHLRSSCVRTWITPSFGYSALKIQIRRLYSLWSYKHKCVLQLRTPCSSISTSSLRTSTCTKCFHRGARRKLSTFASKISWSNFTPFSLNARQASATNVSWICLSAASVQAPRSSASGSNYSRCISWPAVRSAYLIKGTLCSWNCLRTQCLVIIKYCLTLKLIWWPKPSPIYSTPRRTRLKTARWCV